MQASSDQLLAELISKHCQPVFVLLDKCCDNPEVKQKLLEQCKELHRAENEQSALDNQSNRSGSISLSEKSNCDDSDFEMPGTSERAKGELRKKGEKKGEEKKQNKAKRVSQSIQVYVYWCENLLKTLVKCNAKVALNIKKQHLLVCHVFSD